MSNRSKMAGMETFERERERLTVREGKFFLLCTLIYSEFASRMPLSWGEGEEKKERRKKKAVDLSAGVKSTL